MDIDDILTSITSPTTLSTAALDLQALTRAWVSERTSPELLPYPTALMARHSSRLAAQIARIEDLASAMDPSHNFALVVIQTELERVRFLMRSFLRARIAKIDRFALHYLKLAAEEDERRRERRRRRRRRPGMPGESALAEEEQDAEDSDEEETGQHNPLLSPTEQRYAQHHSALLTAHYRASFLGAFPPALQKLDDTGGGTASMVDAPDLDAAVFVRVLRDSGSVVVHGEQGEGEIELRRGDTWVLRWRAVREQVRRGDLELL